MHKYDSLIIELVTGFVSATRQLEWVRNPVAEPHAKILLQGNGKDGWRLVGVDGSVWKQHDYALAIDFPDVVPCDDIDAAMTELAVILAIRLERFFRAKKSNENRPAQARQEAARKAIQARWARQRQKLVG